MSWLSSLLGLDSKYSSLNQINVEHKIIQEEIKKFDIDLKEIDQSLYKIGLSMFLTGYDDTIDNRGDVVHDYKPLIEKKELDISNESHRELWAHFEARNEVDNFLNDRDYVKIPREKLLIVYENGNPVRVVENVV